MKRIALYFGIAAALVASCSTREMDFQTPIQDETVFYATFEQPAEEGTRVYANEDLLLRWTADDRVSIFNKITYNQQYKFTGETGDNAGGFRKVDSDEFVTGNTISHVVSVYPYQEATKITESEVLTVTLPAEQSYAENTFGLGANTMVSVSSDNVLQYKNVGGYLMLKLYGEGVSIESITLRGNNGEKIAGKASITMPLDGKPAAVMANDATSEITLTCTTSVQLGSTEQECTQFWFVVPPMTFEKGFTITIKGEGRTLVKSTEKSIPIERNKVSKMSPVEIEPKQPSNVIYYTSSDENIVRPYDSKVFGATIVSNEYTDGQGIITFDKKVTAIGDFAFNNCGSLTSISLPSGVTSIGKAAFQSCSRLTSINIPNNVTSIGEAAFFACKRLPSIILPNGITSIGDEAFGLCERFTSFTIPESVTSIGSAVFSRCFALTSFKGKYASPDGLFLIDSGTLIAIAYASFQDSVTLPEGITRIGRYAFELCNNYVRITLPSSLEEIGEEAFFSCSNLTDINIPESVTKIGQCAFSECSSLASITMPEGVTSIEYATFSYCHSLRDVVLPKSVTSIEESAFSRCDGLKGITIPENVKRIGRRAFYLCTSLSSITLPESITRIGEEAFYGCNILMRATVLSTTPPWLDYTAFYGCSILQIYVPDISVSEYKLAEGWSDYADRIHAISSPSIPVPEAVDLGLSVKWASFNLCATVPEEYGGYYAWGETELKNDYSWSTYKWCMGSDNTMTKYCNDSSWGYNGFTDTKIVLDPEDDAAFVNLGENWRLPTNAEWTELMENCTWTWTSQNGVSGRLVTAPNGNSIFLPAAGHRVDTRLESVGSCGDYLSSSLCADSGFPYFAWGAYFDSSSVYVGYNYRRKGVSARAVYAE